MNLFRLVPAAVATTLLASVVAVVRKQSKPKIGSAVVCVLAVYAGLFRWWQSVYSSTAVRPFAFTSTVIENITTLSGPNAKFRVKRFRLRMPPGGLDGVNIGRGEHIKVDWGHGWRWRKPGSYSPLSNGVGGSCPHGDTFDLVVKIFDDREGTSKWLDGRKVGDLLDMSGPYPPMAEMIVRNGGARYIGIICYGVGITEAVAVAEAELRRHRNAKLDHAQEVVMIWANRNRDSMVLNDSVELLKREFAHFSVKYLFSAEPPGVGDFPPGRMSTTVISEAFPFLSTDLDASRVFVVGSVDMKKQTWASLKKDFGVRKPHKLIDFGGGSGLVQGLWRVLTRRPSADSKTRIAKL